MERTGLHPALADARQTDEVFVSLKSLRHQCAYCYGNHCSEMTDHREFVLARMAPVNITVASTHRPLTRTQICARHIAQWFAECGSCCLGATPPEQALPIRLKPSGRH